MPAIVSRLRIPAAPIRNLLRNLPRNPPREPHSGPAGDPAIRLPRLWKSWLPAFSARREPNVVESALLCIADCCMYVTFSARGTMQLGLPYRPTPRRPIVCSLVNTTFALPSPPMELSFVMRQSGFRALSLAVCRSSGRHGGRFPRHPFSPAPMPARRSRVSTQSLPSARRHTPHLSLILGYRSLGK